MSEPSVLERFEAAWPRALVAFSPYTRLAPPLWCETVEDEKREGLTGSFAMIRMRDDRIVISLRQIAELGLVEHAHAILSHEVGHYVHAPGTLADHVRLHDRIRRTLAVGLQSFAGLVANLYTDLLLNDRLQRSGAADIAAVYVALRKEDAGELWALYMRTYERLWGLTSGTLTPKVADAVEADAELGARTIRFFRDDWMDGAASFTKLVELYLHDLKPDAMPVPPWLDTASTSIGDQIPDGLLEDDFDPTEVPHPAADGRIGGGSMLGDDEEDRDAEGAHGASGAAGGRALRGDGRPDKRTVTRGPAQWVDMLRAVGIKREGKELVARYYRQLAMPNVIPFPSERLERAGDPLPEGLDAWEAGAPLERIDWFETLARSPRVIPGVTTMERAFGVAEGSDPERRPPDLYVGIDCSGSMGNPAFQIAYPIVAGVILTLSALRAGSRVMACLSGEMLDQGTFVQTDGFVRDEEKLLRVLTDYLGTGCSFGLARLAKTFAFAPPPKKPAHILVVSDSDLFGEIDRTKDGWEIASRAVLNAGAGGTAVLRLHALEPYREWLDKLRGAGFEPYIISAEQDIVPFARAFARRTFSKKQGL